MRHRLFALACAGLIALPAAADPTPKEAVERILKTGAEGAGNKEAALAWKELVAIGSKSIDEILTVYETANPVARNWLRTAMDAIVQGQAAKQNAAIKFERHVMDLKAGPESRRLAYNQLKRIDPKQADVLLPLLVEDRSTEIRREAIASKLAECTAKKLEGDALKGELQKLFAVSRDQDQVEDIAKKLKELKAEVDVAKHFAVIQEWMVVGPFDAEKGKAYATPLLPETEDRIDLRFKYKGKDSKALEWQKVKAKDELGVVDLTVPMAKEKNAVAYAYASIESDKARPAEVRLGSIGAVRVFLNGKEVFAREEYHTGQRHDQYVAKVTLNEGSNKLILKLLQNDQKEPWAQDWSFQARVCDDTGGALPIKYSPLETPKRD